MVDLSAAFRDVKYLPDDALKSELQSPSGMIPGYLIMAELQEREAMRASSGGSSSPSKSMKDELLSRSSSQPTQPATMPQPQGIASLSQPRQYSRGGIVAQLNPFNAMARTLRNPDAIGGYMQEALNNQHGGLPPLEEAQPLSGLSSPWAISDMVPTPSGTPSDPFKYKCGGLASLKRK